MMMNYSADQRTQYRSVEHILSHYMVLKNVEKIVYYLQIKVYVILR